MLNQEFEPVSEERAREIMREIMLEELTTLAVDQQQMALLKEELEALQKGDRIVMPCNIEHARKMFKMASFYLTQNDPEFNLTHEAVK